MWTRLAWTPGSRPPPPPARPAPCWPAPTPPARGWRGGGAPPPPPRPRGAGAPPPDAARALLSRDGEQLLGAVLAATARARERLAGVDGLVVPGGPGADPLVLTLLLPATGADGRAVERDLLAAGLPVEAAERDLVKAVVTLADDDATLTAFTTVVADSVRRHRGAPRPVVGAAVYGVVPVPAVPPRTAFFADRETVPLAEAVGRVCAELVAPYPPGIPVLAPGEEVTAAALGALAAAADAGVRIAYAADPTLATLLVVRR